MYLNFSNAQIIASASPSIAGYFYSGSVKALLKNWIGMSWPWVLLYKRTAPIPIPE